MQLVEYVNSLFEQGLSGEEVIAKTQEWKKKNNYGVSEQPSVLKEDLKPKEEVKIEGVAETTDATVPPTETPEAFENLESGSGQYQFTPIVDEEATSERYLDLINKRALRFKAQTDFDNDVGGVKTKAILKQLPIGSKDRTDFYIQRNLAPDETINESYYNRASGNSAPNSYLIEQGDIDSKFSLEPPKLEASKQTDLKSEDQIVQPIGRPADILGFDKPKKEIPDNFWSDLKEEFEEEKKKGIGTIESYIDGYIEENDLDLDFPNLYFNKDNSTSFIENNYGGADAIAQTNLNPIDFEGFLNRNGFAEEFNEKLNNGVYDDSEGLQDGSLAKERDLRRYLDLYKSEQDARLNQKNKLYSIKKDPGKFKTSTFGDARVDLINALSVPDESDVYYTSIDSNAFKDYIGGQFSISSAKDREYLQKKINYAKELDERGDWYAAAANAGSLIVEAKNGFLTGWYDLSTFALELGGSDTFVQQLRNSEAETQLAKDSSYYTSFSGKTIKIDGIEYAKDQVSGIIYNVSAGYNVSEISDPFRLKFLDKKIEKEGVVKEHNSLRGYLTVGGNTFGNVLTQVIGQKGVSFATKAARVRTLATLNGFTSVKKYKQTLQLAEAIGGKAASRIRIPVKKSTFDAMLFQGSYGAAIGYNNTLKEAKLAGFNDEEAAALAYDGSQLTGIWYAATGPISPRTNWLGKEGQETLVSQLRKSILKARKSNKPRTFVLDFKQRLLNISNNLKSKGYNFVEEGTKETIQENVQQAGEFLWINPVLNKKAKTNFLQDTYSYQEAKTTSILSFATGGLLSQMKLPSFKPKASAMIANYSYIANNMEKAQQQLNRLVESGFATQAEADELVFNAKAIFNNTSRIPKWLDQNLVLPVARLMQQKQDKQNEKKNIAPNFHQEIDNQIENIDLEIDAYIKTSAETQREKLQAGVESFLNKVRKAKGKVDMVPFDTTAEANAYRQELLEQGAEIMQSDNYGDMVVTSEGNKVLIIDNQVNTEDNVVTTGVHEGGHFVLSETIDQDPDAAKKMGNALVDEMFENENVTIKSDKIKRRLATYASQGTPTAVMMEEIMMMVSEGLINGDIEFNETAKTRIGDLIRRTLQNVFGIKVKFKDGNDVLNFLRDYNRTIQTKRGGKAITRVATEGAKVDIADPGIEAARKIGRVKQEIDEETGELKEVELDEVDLGVVAKESKRIEDSQEVQKIYDEQGVAGAMDIIQKFKPITSRIVESRSQAPNFDRQLLTDEIETGPRGILDLIMDYPKYVKEQQQKKEKVAPLAGFINNMLPKRAIEASRRVLGEEFTTDVTEAKGVVAKEEVEVETKEKPLAKKPTETVEFSQTQIEKIGAKDKAEVENRITEATNSSFEGKKITRFGETRNVPKAVADIYAGMFGLNPQTITDKTRNYQKTDAEGLTTAKQFLLKNANNDFARLPKTKDGFGKGTFLPRNVMNALYTDGKLTGTLKDYMDLIRQKPTKPIYRDAVGQTIRGLLNLHIRNRMFEDLVTTTPERLRGGAKFSKRIEQTLSKEAIPEEVKGIKANIQKIITEATPGDLGAFDLSTLESRQEAVRFMENEFFPKLFNVFGVDARVLLKPKELAPSGNNVISYKPGKRVQKVGGALGRDQLGITDVNRASKEIELNKELADAGLVYQVKNILKEFNSLDLKGKKSEAIETALKTQVTKDAESNLKTRELHKKGYKDFLNLFKKLYDSDPTMMRGIGFLFYNPGANFAFYRNLAQIIGAQEGVKKGREEHVYQAGNWARRTLEAMSSKNSEVWKNWLDWSAENYYQEAIEGKDKGKESSEYVVDAIYKKDRYSDPSDRPYWMPETSNITYESQSMEHPLLKSALDKAMKTGDFSKVPDPKIRYYNDYFSLNPNLLGNKGVTDAEKYNVEVPKDFVLNSEVYKYQGELIYGQILTEAGILTGSDAITKSKARQMLDNYLKTAKLKSEAAVINNNLQPNNIKLEGNNAKSSKRVIDELGNLDTALNQARRPDAPVKKIRVFDFDDTLARSKSMVIVNMPDGSSRKINATEFAAEAANLEEQGAEFDFSEFSKVVDGKKGPLFSVAEKIAAARGTDDIFILTARPANAAGPIQAFMKANGIDLKLENIVGLGDGTAAAKGRWIASKAAEGYNDFYFADDAVKNVQAVKDVLSKADVKSKVQQARVKFSKRIGNDLAKNKNYIKFRNSLKGSVLYHGGAASLSDSKAVWFSVNDLDSAELYADRKDGKVYSIDSNNLKNAIIIPDVADLTGLDNIIKNKYKSIAEQVFDEYGQVDIKKVLETNVASEVISDIIDYVDKNFELADGVYGPETLYDNSGKISKGVPVIVIGGDVSTKVKKVEVPKSIRTIPAVADVLNQIDVKSKVQQAKASKRITFDKVFNDIIEAKTGIESYKQFSAAKAKTVGSSKGKFTFFTTPSAEDFLGLLYKTLGKGKVGDAQMAFYKENLLDPFNRAEMAISQAKVAAGRDYKALKKQFKSIPKTLEQETGIAKYSYQHAIRTYIWDSQGLEVPGLSKRDQKRLTDFIKADPELQAFADQLVNIQKGKPYPKPDKDWTAGNITTDVISGINKVNRAEYLQEWQENVDIIFSEKNMNKLEAAFGIKYVEALKDSLRAMKSGSNRPLGGDRVSNQILDWLNNSVGAIMFLNTRSAVLQTISAVNFINWGDNNILKAGKAFANQKQFWGDFLTLMNSDYLLERRDGLKINVSESEIADAVEGSKNKVNAAISYLLNKGFVFTRYADSFAIASGGATFYRNRIESLVEQGMDRKLAEQQAFEDFRLIAEENQQSSSPMRISQQQRSLIGRIVLQFGNTQLQYVRIQKRAVQDLVNGRGDWKANISKIVYYGAIQNLLFNALQSGLAWALFDEDDDDEQLTEANKEQKLERALNGAIDSQLKGLGIQGAVIAGVKNALITIAEQADKKSPKFEDALDDLLSIAPALGSKIRKLKSAARTISWNRKEIKEKGFSMDNPAYLAGAQVISAVFNIPLDRAVMKMNNMRNILNPATENWQKVALALGWSGWDVGLPYFGLAEDKPVLTETEKQTKKLFDLNKSDQVKMLLDLGLTKKEIRALTKEQQRVDEIIKLQNKNKDAGSKK